MNYISNILKPNRIILKSWNYYIPKGYILNKGFLCYAGGYRKSTILLIDLSPIDSIFLLTILEKVLLFIFSITIAE